MLYSLHAPKIRIIKGDKIRKSGLRETPQHLGPTFLYANFAKIIHN